LQRRSMRMRGGTGKGSLVGTGELWLSSASANEQAQLKASRLPLHTISEGSFPEYVCVRATTSYPTAPRQSTIWRIQPRPKRKESLTFIEESHCALQLARRISPGDV
jgi:hypothetical protein